VRGCSGGARCKFDRWMGPATNFESVDVRANSMLLESHITAYLRIRCSRFKLRAG
jgi:hypothetical protein